MNPTLDILKGLHNFNQVSYNSDQLKVYYIQTILMSRNK